MKTDVSYGYRANQTEAHQKLVEQAYLWMLNRSYRGVRATSEFSPTDGYSCDLLAIMSFFGVKYNERYIPKPELRQSRCVLVFEAKASRPDFLKHFGEGKDNIRTQAPMGHLHWILVTNGLVDPSEIPGFWGLLEQRGTGLVEVKRPLYCEITKARMDEIGHDLLWAEYNEMRELECARVMKIVAAMKSRGLTEQEQ